jgi:hypothetical protein
MIRTEAVRAARGRCGARQRQPLALAVADGEPPSVVPGPPIVPVLPKASAVPALPAVGPGWTGPASAALPEAPGPIEPLEPSAGDPRVSGAGVAGAASEPGTVPGVPKPLPGSAPVSPGAAPLVTPDESTLGPLHGGVPGLVATWAAATPASAMDAAATTALAMHRAFMRTSPVWSDAHRLVRGGGAGARENAAIDVGRVAPDCRAAHHLCAAAIARAPEIGIFRAPKGGAA